MFLDIWFGVFYYCLKIVKCIWINIVDELYKLIEGCEKWKEWWMIYFC